MGSLHILPGAVTAFLMVIARLMHGLIGKSCYAYQRLQHFAL